MLAGALLRAAAAAAPRPLARGAPPRTALLLPAAQSFLPPRRVPRSIRGLAQGPRCQADSRKDANPKPPPPSPSHSPSPSPSASPSPSPSVSPSPSSPSPDNRATPPPENPFDHLPDLTRGIPSTYEYEAAKASRSALAQVQQQDQHQYGGDGGEDGSGGGVGVGGGGRRSRGELPASAYVSSTDRRRKRLAGWLLVTTGTGLIFMITYAGRDWDPIEAACHPDVPSGWGFGLWWARLATRLGETMNYYREPAFEKLLPDLEPGVPRPFTLVIGLEDVLVHSEWTREHGWRVAKRPGMDYFVRYLRQYYELVVFTTAPSGIADPVLRQLDPYHLMLPLFREATKWKDGSMVKDLSYLNRDLSGVIVIETDPNLVRNQAENAVILPPWRGDPRDGELVALIPFLEYLHTVAPADVRRVLASFRGKHIPTEFARREAISRREWEARQLKQGGGGERSKKPPTAAGGGCGALGAIRGALGLRPPALAGGEPDWSEGLMQGKMLQDVIRERGQRNYEVFEREIQLNGKKWLEEERAWQEKAQKEMMTSMVGWMKGWMPVVGKAEKEEGGKKEGGEGKMEKAEGVEEAESARGGK